MSTGGFADDPAADAWAEADLDMVTADLLLQLGVKIRGARKAAGLTQEALAERLVVSQTAVSYWETGKRDPGVADLLRIAEALGVPAASLLPGSGRVAPQEAAEGRLARVEVKGFRDLGIVRVSESALAGEPMLRAESADGAVAEFPASSLHFITWLPEGAVVPERGTAAITRANPDYDGDGWDSRDDDDLDDGDLEPDYAGGPF